MSKFKLDKIVTDIAKYQKLEMKKKSKRKTPREYFFDWLDVLEGKKPYSYNNIEKLKKGDG